MLHVLYGEEGFLVSQALDELRAELEPSLRDANTANLEAAGLEFEQLRAACEAIPFLSPKRLVIVRGLLARFQPRPQRAAGERPARARRSSGEGRDAWLGLANYAGRQESPLATAMPETTLLALVDGDTRRDNPLLRALLAAAAQPSSRVIAHAFPRLRGSRLHDWLTARIRDQGGSVSLTAARLLASYGGDGLWSLANEIEKLIIYTGGRRIEEKDVRLLCGRVRDANVFQLIDAAVAGRTDVALALLRQMEIEGAAVPYLIVMFARQFRLLIQARELLQAHTAPPEIKARLGIAEDWMAERLLEQARRFSEQRLLQVHRRLLEADLAAKRGRGELALDLLVADLARGR